MKNLLLILALLLFNSLTAQDCQSLVNYRDTQLYAQYDKAFKKYTITQNAKNDVEKIRKELLDETSWNASDGRLTIGMIASNLKMTTTLISGLLQFHPSAGLANKSVKLLSAENFLVALEARDAITTLMEDGAEKAAYQLVLSKGGPLSNAVKSVWDLAEEFEKMTSLPEERTKFREDIKRSLDLIDLEISKYDTAINDNSYKMEQINIAKEGIDKYLNKNCGPITFSVSGNSGVVNFGQGNSCNWSVQMQNVNFNFTLNRSNKTITAAGLHSQIFELTTRGGCTPAGRLSTSYEFTQQSVNGNTINLQFQPSRGNHQKCNASFTGTLSSDGKQVNGTLTWRRTDQQGTINYVVSMPVTLK